MTVLRTAAVLGLGLIGGSLARDLRRSGVSVRGWDVDGNAIDAARRSGVVEPLGDDLDGVADVDLVVLAVPVRSAPDLLARIAPLVSPHALVTDVGSTKSSITTAAHAAGLASLFVGSHPLAGDHRSGWSASREELFRGRRVFLTPTAATPSHTLAAAQELWRSVGATIEILRPEAHDREMAWVSHLPQAVSSALGVALADANVASSRLGPGGRDVTRLAGSAAGMWADILCDNSDDVVAALRAFSSRIASLTSAVERGELPEIRRILADAGAWASMAEAPATRLAPADAGEVRHGREPAEGSDDPLRGVS